MKEYYKNVNVPGKPMNYKCIPLCSRVLTLAKVLTATIDFDGLRTEPSRNWLLAYRAVCGDIVTNILAANVGWVSV